MTGFTVIGFLIKGRNKISSYWHILTIVPSYNTAQIQEINIFLLLRLRNEKIFYIDLKPSQLLLW